MALHEQSVGASDEWYTPPYVFTALGCEFDMDVAHPGAPDAPWIPAREFISADSLAANWHGFIWMNPPFGGRNALDLWLRKFMAHGDGVALVPARTSAPWWQSHVPLSSAVLFVRRKIRFIGGDGRRNTSPAQGSCLLASGRKGEKALYRAEELGLGTLFFPSRVVSAKIRDAMLGGDS